jgi:putative flippase GtrA
MIQSNTRSEILTAAKFGGVGCLGFLTDITVLRLGLVIGLSPLTARLISLACAMQVTFLVNGLIVFRCLRPDTALRQWLSYMSSNGVGNLCNYFIFAGLVLSRWPLVSRHGPALVIGSLTAYLINYAGCRLLVFGKPAERGGACEIEFAPSAAPTETFEG